MLSSAILGLILLLMLSGRITAEENGEGAPGSKSYQCVYCSEKIDNQTAILNRISYASEKLVQDVAQIKTGVADDIPAKLEKQTGILDGLKTAVGSDIPAQLEKQSSELERQAGILDGLKTAVGTDIPAQLEKQSLELKKQSSELERQAGDLGELKTAVGSAIPSQLKTQSSDLEQLKTSNHDITIGLKKHSEELLVHDERLKEQGRLLEQLISLVKDSLVGPKDCSDIRALGHSTNGVYQVYPGSLAKRIQSDVYCDMTTPGGNWLVFQRRKDGTVNFERTWIDYVNGFGNSSGEFWLGNELLYLLTSNRKYKLRIDMEDFDGQKRYAEYSTFSIGSSADNYRLTVGGYSGNAGDSFSGHSGMQFSTKDADNDIHKEVSCSQLFRGGWWYHACHSSNLNGLYLGGAHKSYADGIEWYTFRGHYYSLKITEMKLAALN